MQDTDPKTAFEALEHTVIIILEAIREHDRPLWQAILRDMEDIIAESRETGDPPAEFANAIGSLLSSAEQSSRERVNPPDMEA